MNHCFTSSQRVLTGNALDEALREIIQRRFKDTYQVKRSNDHWEISHPASWNLGFSCWLRTKRKIEFRPKPGPWAAWVTTVFQEELAAKFSGRCSSEGVPKVHAPEPNKYKFKSWWKEAYGYEQCPREIRTRMWQQAYDRIPDSLKRFA